MKPKLRIIKLNDSGDTRGYSFTVPAEVLKFLSRIRDVHVASMVAGAVRGNHFHLRRREAIVIVHHGEWSLLG